MFEWWSGYASVEAVGAVDGAETRSTAYLDQAVYEDMDPRRPMDMALRTHGDGERVVVSCLVSDFEFDWRLRPLNGGRETRIDVAVAVPERRANRYELMRRIVDDSIPRLIRLAEEEDAA